MELYDGFAEKKKRIRKLGFDFRIGKLTRVVRERAAIPLKRMVAMEALLMYVTNEFSQRRQLRT